jgi:hypothetical protein
MIIAKCFYMATVRLVVLRGMVARALHSRPIIRSAVRAVAHVPVLRAASVWGHKSDLRYHLQTHLVRGTPVSERPSLVTVRTIFAASTPRCAGTMAGHGPKIRNAIRNSLEARRGNVTYSAPMDTNTGAIAVPWAHSDIRPGTCVNLVQYWIFEGAQHEHDLCPYKPRSANSTVR